MKSTDSNLQPEVISKQPISWLRTCFFPFQPKKATSTSKRSLPIYPIVYFISDCPGQSGGKNPAGDYDEKDMARFKKRSKARIFESRRNYRDYPKTRCAGQSLRGACSFSPVLSYADSRAGFINSESLF